MQIFIGNLPYTATEEDIKKLFGAFGAVVSVSLKKKSGGDPRGFGFVDMPDDAHAQAAITGLESKEFMGRALSVSVRRPSLEKPKKDYKAIKKARLEAKLKAEQPLELVENLPEVKAVRPKHAKYSGRRGPKVWEKRQGTGKANAWKKKPGGVKKKFRTQR